MDPRQAFGNNVRAARQRRGLSQEALADEVGLHRTYIGGIERGERNVSLVNMCRLAGALKCQPAELLSGIPSIPPR